MGARVRLLSLAPIPSSVEGPQGSGDLEATEVFWSLPVVLEGTLLLASSPHMDKQALTLAQ